MRITGLHIDRFGVWTDLKMEGLEQGMTVFYGPNEAGKSTLMQYIRTVLYGFKTDRCQRFVTGQRANNGTLIAADDIFGGSLVSSARDGDWHIRRLADKANPLGSPGEVRVTGPGGEREGAQRLNTILSGIDEAIFNNVFAVGLREMQALGALNDTQAARQLYSLSTGTDRVSLVDVTRQLQLTRCRLVGCDDQPSLLGELVSQQNRCRTTIDQLSTNADRWASLVAERDAMEEEITRLEAGREKTTNRARLAKMVLEVQPQWEELRRVDRELELIGSVSKIAPRTIESIQSTAVEVESQRQRIDDLKMRRELIREQISQLEDNESVDRHSARILAMLDQRRAIGATDARVVQLQNELDETELEILAEQERLGLRWDSRSESAAVVSTARETDSIPDQTKLSRAERKRRKKNKPRRAGGRTVGPQNVGPQNVGPQNIGPQAAGPQAVDPRTTGLQNTGHQAIGPRTVGPQNVAHTDNDIYDEPLTEREAAYEHATGQVTRGSNLRDKILPVFDSAMIAALQEPAVSLERERQMLEVTKKETASYRDESRRIEREIATALGHAPDWFDNRSDDDVMRALEDTTELTDALRRQKTLQRDFEEIEDDLAEVEDRRELALTSQLLPWDLVKALGALFSIGAGLVLSSLFGEWFGWGDTQRGVLLIMGLVATGVAAFLKFSLDSPARDGLRDTDRKNDELKRALSALESEKQSLQGKLSSHDIGSLSLRDTETRLVQLEALLPLEQQRRGTLELAEQASQRAIEIAKTMKQTRARWEQSLGALGLSTRITPEQMRALSGQSGSLSQLHRIREQRATDLEEARREQQRVGERVRDLLADTLIRPIGERPSDHLNQLAAALQQQNELEKRRESLKEEDLRLRREQQNATSRLNQLQRSRRSQITSTGALDEADLERIKRERAKYEELTEYRSAVRESIQSLQSNFGPDNQQDLIRRELERDDVAVLPQRLARAQADLDQSESRLKELQYRCGEITEQIKQLTADRSVSNTQLELNALQYQIDKGIEKWKVVSTISGLLKGVYSKYEKDRQPETLKDASRHLKRMTNGRYTRVWTPLADDALVVDDADGKPLPVEVLSRGTREQLFLSLRLALIACYARRGVHMPIVLDDVLVNFDSERTIAAATVLADFARAGHQVFVFTCHSHIRELFENLQVDVRDLPDNRSRGIGVAAVETVVETPAVEPVAALPIIEPGVEAPLIAASPVATRPILGFADEFPPEIPAEYIAEWHMDEPAAPVAQSLPIAFAGEVAEAGVLLGVAGETGYATQNHFDDFGAAAYTSPPVSRDSAAWSSAANEPPRFKAQTQFDFYDSPPVSSFREIAAESEILEFEDAFFDSTFNTPPVATTKTRQIPDVEISVSNVSEFEAPPVDMKNETKAIAPRTDLNPPPASLQKSEKKSRVVNNYDTKKRDEDQRAGEPMIEAARAEFSTRNPLPPILAETKSVKRRETRIAAVDKKVGLLKAGFATPKVGLLKPGFATGRVVELQSVSKSKAKAKTKATAKAIEKPATLPPATFSDSVRDFLDTKSDENEPLITSADHEAKTTMTDSSLTNATGEYNEPLEQDELLITDADDSQEDEYEYVEVDVDEDGNEIEASDDDEDEYEYVDAEDDEEEVAEGEEDEYEYVEVDVDEDGNEIEASDDEEEDEYEFVEVDEDEVDEADDDEYEYVEVDVDEDGNEIEASDEEDDDEYEYIDVDVDEDGNEIEASDEDDEYEDEEEDEYEDEEVAEDETAESSKLPSFGDVADALSRKVTGAVEDLLDDQTDAA